MDKDSQPLLPLAALPGDEAPAETQDLTPQPALVSQPPTAELQLPQQPPQLGPAHSSHTPQGMPVQSGYIYQPINSAIQQSSTNVTVVTQPGIQRDQHRTIQAKPNNYLIFSVLNIFCCCLILGIIALIYSLQVDSAYNQRDYEGASCASRRAKKWNIAALVVGIAGMVVLVMNVVGFVTVYYGTSFNT